MCHATKPKVERPLGSGFGYLFRNSPETSSTNFKGDQLMKNLKRLSAAVILTCALGLSAFAGQPMTSCPPPDPGHTLTPCDPGSTTITGALSTPTVTSTTSDGMGEPTAASDETSLTEIAAKVFLTFLSLF